MSKQIYTQNAAGQNVLRAGHRVSIDEAHRDCVRIMFKHTTGLEPSDFSLAQMKAQLKEADVIGFYADDSGWMVATKVPLVDALAARFEVESVTVGRSNHPTVIRLREADDSLDDVQSRIDAALAASGFRSQGHKYYPARDEDTPVFYAEKPLLPGEYMMASIKITGSARAPRIEVNRYA
jgi:hypothetical protein